MSKAMTEQERDDLLIDFATAAMATITPTFGSLIESKRQVIAHKSFLLAEAMVDAYERRAWERGGNHD